MSVLSRRKLLAALGAGMGAGLLPLVAQAENVGWLEVMGSATASGPGDRDAARRRALADALLSAALAGGAVVKGHSVLSDTRLTSDLLVVRPTGTVLSHRIVREEFDGQLWRITIRARVGVATEGYCGERRRLFITMYPPEVRSSPEVPAWAEALAADLALRLAEDAEAHPSVAGLSRASRLPNPDPARDRVDYLALTTGDMRRAAGGHGLSSSIRIEPAGRRLRMELRLRLDGPGGERIEKVRAMNVRLPRPSLLGDAAVLLEPDRRNLSAGLTAGVREVLETLLAEAGCKPVLATIERSGRQLQVQVGRAHGVKATSLAFTVDGEASTEILEVVRLSDRHAVLSPLDPARHLTAFAGRPVRFFDTTERPW